MTRLTQTLSLITALLSGGVYETASANPTTPDPVPGSTQPLVQSLDTNDESRRIMMEARIAMGKELNRR